MAATSELKSTSQSQSPTSKVEGAAPASRTRGIVGGIEGFDAQAAALAPKKEPGPVKPGAKGEGDKAEGKQAPAADATRQVGVREDKGGPEVDSEKLSPLREAMLQQFQLMEGKGIGDAEFESVCGKDWWVKRKQNEAAAKKYNTEELPALVADWEAKCKADPNYAKANPKPPRKDDSSFTTCIAMQGKLLEAAFKATDLHVKRADVKYDLFGYGTMGRIEAKKRDAWVESKVGIGERPKAGDILVLEMRGAADKVQKDIDGENSQYGMFGQSEQKMTKELTQLKAASASANDAISKAAAAKMPLIEAKLAELRAKHDQKIAALQVKLDAARAETAAKAGTEKSVKGGNRMGGLDFSHVGLFKEMAPEIDAEGKATGREIWQTFDGGAHVPGKIDAQGAKSNTRLYDPKTNEIVSAAKGAGGALTQDGKTRWLGGWTNIDKLVDPAAQKK